MPTQVDENLEHPASELIGWMRLDYRLFSHRLCTPGLDSAKVTIGNVVEREYLPCP